MNTNTAVSSPTRAGSGTRRAAAHAFYDWAALIGRIGLAAVFLWSGYGKLAHMDFSIGYMKAFGVPAPELMIWPALLVELIGGAMLVVGWKARWAAVALVLFTAAATLIFHAYWGAPVDQVLNQQIHFMKNLAMLGGLLGILAHGPGRIALER